MSLAQVDLEDLVFLMSSIPADFYTITTSLSQSSLSPEGEGFDADIPFSVECSKVSHARTVSGCGSLYLFPSAAERSFSGVW